MFGNVSDALKSGIGGDLLNKGLEMAQSADAIKQMLDSDVAKAIAEKTGLPLDSIGPKLTAVLPELIKSLQVDGKVDLANLPTEKLIAAATNLLKN